MVKLAVLKTKDIFNSLPKKGFQVAQKSHVFFVLWVNGKRTSVSTMVSHGAREIGDNLINAMSAELKLEKNEFVQLVECTMSGEDYVKVLREKGVKIFP